MPRGTAGDAVPADVQATEATDATDATGTTDETDTTDVMDATDATDATGATDITDATDTTEATDATDTPDGPITPSPDASWTLALLPDTQYYAKSYPGIFEAQTAWIAANVADLNIAFVLHEGDVTNNNTDIQWAAARAAMDALNDADVPYAIAPGNHDYGANGKTADRSTLMNEYFSMADYDQSPAVGAFEPGKIDNTWHTFSAGGQDYLVLALEFGPRHKVVAWADGLIVAHPDHMVILVTHAYTFFDESRYDWATKGESQEWNSHSDGIGKDPEGVNDGEELWQKLLAKHPNVILAVNGHVLGDGTGHVISLGNAGNVVHQILANYQTGVKPAQPDGGGGFLRLMTFHPDGSVEVQSYSPPLDEYLTADDQAFTITFDPADYDYLAPCSPGRVATCTCEGGGPGGRACQDDGTFGQCYCDDDGAFGFIEIEDDPDNKTLAPCDPGPITSPGADLDAVELLGGDGDVIATVIGCTLSDQTPCDNDNDDPEDAQGSPDADGSEAGGGYVSLNGGVLRCGWSGGQVIQQGQAQVLTLYEIGKSVENYRFRLCKGPGVGCISVTAYGTGVQMVPVDSLF